MTSPPSLFHAFLRPSILQILRATGYHSTRPVVLDSLTDLAARYLTLLCEKTAANAVNNHGVPGDYNIVDVRLALQDVGALLPERMSSEQTLKGDEDMRGVEEFIQWFAGARMKEMMEMSSGDGELDATDYLAALKKKHSKTGDDAKYQGSIFGRFNDVGEIQVEGGPITSIDEWISTRTPKWEPPPPPLENGEHTEDQDSRPPSSGLSSVGDRLGDEDMDLT
ncbi:Transcription initiation factor TFIID subunit 3-like protein [Cladobotryum mycophilum]|uniref:Transcription initiation factor TFIID subunit 3-like protein n=1 Tax=Cladobotryum mycophilum TaxID=491253 RepID=A0ABR0SFI7_9HYPO